LSSFKTQTGPGTIYDRLLHPLTNSAGQELDPEEPGGNPPKTATSNATDVEPREQTGLEATAEDTTALAPAFRDPKS
jgi:hypothetical protein